MAGTMRVRAEGPWSDLALHTIGWKAFQDLCAQVCEEVLRRPVQVYREAQDGGQDAVFLSGPGGGHDATIQCKHSADGRRRLRVGDIAAELASVDRLVALGQAKTYILMTSMGVDAPVACAIRARLRARGVARPHVLGREWLIRSIRARARLRALVPQVYGLGDLGAILDERMAAQSRALLEQWLPKLRSYVPTEAHRRAVHALNEHGAVLLLGNPSAGKSTIGAILSAMASEEAGCTVLHLTGPRELGDGWNPNDRKRFFWIDDAFGPNVMRDEYVQDWSSAFRKIEAALSHGNRFLLTSRRHIYQRAKPLLGQRNLAAFVDGRAVVDVGALTGAERAQILYNHVAFGGQAPAWKASVKPCLDAVAEVDGFLPGVAERLGDPAFTRGLRPTVEGLLRFMREPREHLVETIGSLGDTLRAALMLVYVHQGRLSADGWDDDTSRAVADLLGVRLADVRNRIAELAGSFVVERSAGGGTWTFSHPTIGDALTEILRGQAHLVAALLRGIAPENILSGFVSEGMPAARDAGIIPASMNDVVAARIAGVEDRQDTNRSLFLFLARRASDDLLARVVAADPGLLDRATWRTERAADDPWLNLVARAHRLRLLPETVRARAAAELAAAAVDGFELSFLPDPGFLALLPPGGLVALGLELRTRALPAVAGLIRQAAATADPEEDPDRNFERFEEGFGALADIGVLDDGAEELIEEARDLMAEAVHDLVQRRRERHALTEPGDEEEEWAFASATTIPEIAAAPPPPRERPRRSIFSDVDRTDPTDGR